jgi:hypothetical protein
VSRVPLAISTTFVVLLAIVPLGAAANPLIPTPIGAGRAFHPRALSASVAQRRRVAGLTCAASEGRRFGVHIELFARGRVVIVPAGIGVAPPWSSPRPHVVVGACSYAARTSTATGVVELTHGSSLTLGRFFALWSQPLDARRLVGFRAGAGERVRAWVGGVPWRGSVRDIPLWRHAEIVLELGKYIAPHTTYLFWKGL